MDTPEKATIRKRSSSTSRSCGWTRRAARQKRACNARRMRATLGARAYGSSLLRLQLNRAHIEIRFEILLRFRALRRGLHARRIQIHDIALRSRFEIVVA